MKVLNLRMYQLRKLKELPIERGVLNTEALMLILNKKLAGGKRMVLKYLDGQEDERIMARKLYTVSMLNSSDSYKDISELLIPEYAVCVDGALADFAMEIIENHKNLGTILNNESVLLSKKIPLLVQMGNIIDKVQRVEKESFRMQFSDLNEYNFVVDENGGMFAVDLDSAYVGQDGPTNGAYYLLKNPYIDSLWDKYFVDKNENVIPSDNTDLYCYNMIILNTLAKESMHSKGVNTFYMYLNHMKDVGVSSDLVDAFSKLYLPVNNINPKDMLEDIDCGMEKDLDFKVFLKEYKGS